MQTRIDDKAKVKPYEYSIRKKFSSYMLMMFFALGSISILFVALAFTYVFSKSHGGGAPPLNIPAVFFINTVIIAGSSFALWLADRAFKRDHVNLYKMWLYVALLFGISFLVGQVIGWYLLSVSGFWITEHQSGSFLYVISGIHAVHILGGIAFLLYIFMNASRRLYDPALALIYFTDPIPKAQLRLASYYWHFLGGLWLLLLIFFAAVR